MKKIHRILAVLGVALVAIGVVTMFVSGFLPALRALLLNISLMCTLVAAAILLAMMFIRDREKRAAAESQPSEDEENASRE